MPRKPKPDSDHHVPVTISFEPEQYKEIIAYCERNERALSWVVRRALTSWLERHKNDSIED